MRLRNTFLIFLLVFLVNIGLDAKPKIEIVYPKTDEPVLSVDSVFVFGNVQPPESQLFINSQPVNVFSNGAFLKMMPVEPDHYVFDCQALANGDTTVLRHLFSVPDFLFTSSSDSLVIDTSFVFPREWVLLNAGECFRVVAKGTPRCTATFEIEGLEKEIPMQEVAANQRYFWGHATIGGIVPTKQRGVEGVYTGTYQIKPTDHVFDRRIRITLKNAPTESLCVYARGRFSADTTATALLVRRPLEYLDTHSIFTSRGMYHIPSNAKFRISGKYGDYVRVQFTENEQVWTRIDTIAYYSLNTRSNTGIIYSVSMSKTGNKTLVSVRLGEKIPIKIEQINQPPRLLISFYGVRTNYKNVYNLRSASQIKNVEWISESDSIHQLSIELDDNQIWGYKPIFEGNHFILEIRNSPDIPRWPVSPLKNKVITLDPGHSPDTGAIGPTNLAEKDANLHVCHRIRRQLEEKGAMVVLTRDREQGITLNARPKLAAFVDSDILISVHFNSLPDGVNPYKNRGTSTYYYQPMSYDLAHIIHDKLLRELKLPDFGLFYRNLVMTQPTEMLSVLIEPAFIIHPEEEMLIRSEAFQEKIANALVDALEEFYQTHR